jgi:hypothetical protein
LTTGSSSVRPKEVVLGDRLVDLADAGRSEVA